MGGRGAGSVESWGVAEDGPSDPLALALLVPRKLTEGSSKF